MNIPVMNLLFIGRGKWLMIAGDLCLCDGWRVCIVLVIEKDGISIEEVKIRWEELEFWVEAYRLSPYP
jgi:hypothetical protein|tara:strand:+ start:106 stop:309 length:204 start_codon:yes stop_codon:yes gene_type:complete